MPKAIVTGATGYIGSHVVKYLLSLNWDVCVIKLAGNSPGNIADVIDQVSILEYNGNIQELVQFMKQCNADVVMHLAAAVITNPDIDQVSTLIQSNIEFGTEILEAMRYSSTRLFIGTGTYWQNYNSANYNPVDLYAATKEAFEKILLYYVEAHGFRAVTLRLFDVYGEDDSRPKLWNILRDIAGTDQTIDVTGGEQILDMVHVSDVARAYEQAYYWIKNTSKRNNVFGIYSDEQYPLKEIVNLFARILGKKININWGARPYKEREVMKPFSEFHRLPGWQPRVNLEEGLTKFNNRGG